MYFEYIPEEEKCVKVEEKQTVIEKHKYRNKDLDELINSIENGKKMSFGYLLSLLLKYKDKYNKYKYWKYSVRSNYGGHYHCSISKEDLISNIEEIFEDDVKEQFINIINDINPKTKNILDLKFNIEYQPVEITELLDSDNFDDIEFYFMCNKFRKYYEEYMIVLYVKKQMIIDGYKTKKIEYFTDKQLFEIVDKFGSMNNLRKSNNKWNIINKLKETT